MPTLLVTQPAGLGDIFFLLKAVTEKLESSSNLDQAVWPVIPAFLPIVKDLFRSEKLKPILFCLEAEEIIGETITLDFASANIRNPQWPTMASKYLAFGLDFNGWEDYLDWSYGDRSVEDLLAALGYPEEYYSDGYTFVNKEFNSPPHTKESPYMSSLVVENPVEMSIRPDVSFWEWVRLARCADHIHTAETSLLYPLYAMGLEGVTIYSKWTPPQYNGIAGVFDKKDLGWNWVL